MTKTAPQPKTDGLEQKFKLLALLPYDERARRKHCLVFGFVLDWYHSKYGDALASVRHVVETIKERDPSGKGISLPHVHSALTDLVAWGYLEQSLGAGKRASRYVPNWSLLNPSVTPVGNANGNDPSVTPGVNTAVTPGVNATHLAVTSVGNEDPSTGPGDKTRGHVVGNEFEAAPLAPLADGLPAVAAESASGGFASFWSIWPRKHGKAAARTAFGKIDAGLHDTIFAAARSWAEHYAKHAVEKKWIPEPANWLDKERWDEDLPIIHDDSKGAAIAKAKANATPQSSPTSSQSTSVASTAALMIGSINPFSEFGTFNAQIVSSGVREEQPGEQILTLEINWSGQIGDVWPADTWHEFLVHSERSAPARERGREMLGSIAAAVGLEHVDDTDQLHRRAFLCTIHEDLTITYSPVAANDNSRLEDVA